MPVSSHQSVAVSSSSAPSITHRVLEKYRAEGIEGILRGVVRKIIGPDITPTTHPIGVALEKLISQSGFCIVQIGAFTGDSENDPLFAALSQRMRQTNGTLVVVEPVKVYFDELVKNYAGIPGVIFENVAIANRNGQATFYRLGVDPVAHGYPDWLCQLGSLVETRMTTLWDSYEAVEELQEFYLKHRIEETVDCITFDELAARHRLAHIDMLQIDVEGYEYEILRTIDFRRWPIRFVNFESALLHDHMKETRRYMRQFGYRLADFGSDTFCYKRADERLAKSWSKNGPAERARKLLRQLHLTAFFKAKSPEVADK